MPLPDIPTYKRNTDGTWGPDPNAPPKPAPQPAPQPTTPTRFKITGKADIPTLEEIESLPDDILNEYAEELKLFINAPGKVSRGPGGPGRGNPRRQLSGNNAEKQAAQSALNAINNKLTTAKNTAAAEAEVKKRSGSQMEYAWEKSGLSVPTNQAELSKLIDMVVALIKKGDKNGRLIGEYIATNGAAWKAKWSSQ